MMDRRRKRRQDQRCENGMGAGLMRLWVGSPDLFHFESRTGDFGRFRTKKVLRSRFIGQFCIKMWLTIDISYFSHANSNLKLFSTGSQHVIAVFSLSSLYKSVETYPSSPSFFDLPWPSWRKGFGILRPEIINNLEIATPHLWLEWFTKRVHEMKRPHPVTRSPPPSILSIRQWLPLFDWVFHRSVNEVPRLSSVLIIWSIYGHRESVRETESFEFHHSFRREYGEWRGYRHPLLPIPPRECGEWGEFNDPPFLYPTR